MEEPDSEVGEQETDAQFADYLERVCRMERARPAGAPSLYELREDPDLDLEMVQLEAFEEGLEAWWTIRTEEELDERLESLSAYRRAP